MTRALARALQGRQQIDVAHAIVQERGWGEYSSGTGASTVAGVGSDRGSNDAGVLLGRTPTAW